MEACILVQSILNLDVAKGCYALVVPTNSHRGLSVVIACKFDPLHLSNTFLAMLSLYCQYSLLSVMK